MPERPTHPLRDATEDEKLRYAAVSGVYRPDLLYEAYPEAKGPGPYVEGRYWIPEQLNTAENRCSTNKTR